MFALEAVCRIPDVQQNNILSEMLSQANGKILQTYYFLTQKERASL